MYTTCSRQLGKHQRSPLNFSGSRPFSDYLLNAETIYRRHSMVLPKHSLKSEERSVQKIWGRIRKPQGFLGGASVEGLLV